MQKIYKISICLKLHFLNKYSQNIGFSISIHKKHLRKLPTPLFDAICPFGPRTPDLINSASGAGRPSS